VKKIKKLRGISCDIAYAEEFAYMSPAVLYNIIMPLLGMKNAIMIGISTPIDSYSFFQKFFDLKDDVTGAPLVNTYKVTLVCDMCLEKKTNMEECQHRMKYIPPWKSDDPASFKLMKAVFSDNMNIFFRENR
jgi:hypothetical protein